MQYYETPTQSDAVIRPNPFCDLVVVQSCLKCRNKWKRSVVLLNSVDYAFVIE